MATQWPSFFPIEQMRARTGFSQWTVPNRVVAMDDPEPGDRENRATARVAPTLVVTIGRSRVCKNNAEYVTTDKLSNSALLFLRKPVETSIVSRSPDLSHPRRLPIVGQWLLPGRNEDALIQRTYSSGDCPGFAPGSLLILNLTFRN